MWKPARANACSPGSGWPTDSSSSAPDSSSSSSSSDSTLASRNTASAGATSSASSCALGVVGEHALVGVEDVEERLGGEQRQLAQRHRGRRPAENSVRPWSSIASAACAASSDRPAVLGVARLLLQARDRLLQRLQVGQDQLGVDRLDVGARVDPAVDVHDVGVGEHPDHLADRVGLADVGQELVAQPGALGLAPLTMPAMSTNDTTAGTIFAECEHLGQLSSRGSGSGTTPTFGSIVANG